MQFSVTTSATSAQKSECCVVFISSAVSTALKTDDAISAQAIDSAVARTAKQTIASGDFKAREAEILTLHEPKDCPAERLVLVGTGKNQFTAASLHRLFVTLSKKLLALPVKAALIDNIVDIEGLDTAEAAALLARSAEEASYAFTAHHSKKPKPKTLKKLSLRATSENTSALRAALKRGARTGEGVNISRELGDQPGNICNPAFLASEAKKLAAQHEKLSCKVLSEAQMKRLGMHSLLSVSAGTTQPAQLIVLEYKGATSGKPVVLVGKGVTFDTGGISLKPGAAMDEMKYDMCGAASVIGTLHAVAAMNLKRHVIGIIPAVENMPGGSATRPGDIVTSMSGQTIEILNTDAEGRLILCDALTYAERFKPEVIIDIATLTGACVVALGEHATGLFSNDDDLADALLSSGVKAGDRAWRLPLWEEYDKQLKSNFADMANIGGPKAGSATAAAFLHRFTKKQRWAHLDIAGTAWRSGAAKGATGRPVPLLVEYLQS
ncbi:MAG: leucyl aminopeptidase [bacterium]